MKVLYILHSTTKQAGATKSFMTMLSGLMAKGISPIVLIPDNDGIYSDLITMGIPSLVIPYRQYIYPKYNSVKDLILFVPLLLKWIYLNKKAARRLADYIKDHPVDMIHTNTTVVNIGFDVAKRLHIPHVYHIREYADKDFNMHYIPCSRVFHRKLKKPNSYCISITRDIQRYHHVEEIPSSRYIYNGIMPQKSEWHPIEKKRYFLFAGRIEPAKGVTELLEGYQIYHSKTTTPVPLYLAGAQYNKNYSDLLLQFIAKHHLSDSVSFLGIQTNLDKWMSNALAIVISSPNEAFGRCMAEAMMNDCLVIGHNTGGTMEQFDNGVQMHHEEIGLRYMTAEELADLLYNVEQTSPEHYCNMREKAFVTANTLYSNENNAEQIYQFYEDILSHKI